jgi:hypothetical protein
MCSTNHSFHRFLHAWLQLEALRQYTSARDAEKTLNEFPPGMDAIYKTTWTRIVNQKPKHVDLAKHVLLWVYCGRMPLEALRDAVATCPDTHVYDEQRLVPESLILSVCCGLVEAAVPAHEPWQVEPPRVIQFIRKFITSTNRKPKLNLLPFRLHSQRKS